MEAKKEWNKIINSKLKEGQTVADLRTTYDSDIIMDPNIVAGEVSHLNHYLEDAKPWINMAAINGDTAKEINILALQALNHGANGLMLIPSQRIEIKEALQDVMTQYLDVIVVCNDWGNEEITRQKQALDAEKIPNVSWSGSGHVVPHDISSEDRIASYKSLLSLIDPSKSNDINITLSKNLLFEIASLRALRILLQTKGVDKFRILSRYDVEGSNDLGDYNLIEKTYKVMSGIMGCADIVITTYNGDEDSRLSLNIHNVLELESGFKNVIDPVGGAYYIEKLVSEIVKACNI